MIDCQPDASKTFSGVQWAQCLNTHPLYLDTGFHNLVLAAYIS